MISNLSLLGFFKYANFLTFNYTALVESLGLIGMGFENVLKVTLPLGISFYTFQSMSYAIDVYRGDALAIRSGGQPENRNLTLGFRIVVTAE